MADVLRFSERVIGGGIIRDTVTLQQQPASFGLGVLPSLNFELQNGTGSGQANKWFLERRTVNATTYDLLDLAGGVDDYKGDPITFTAIKRCLLKIVDPNGTKKLYLGPQNQTNAAQLWAGGTGATAYDEVFWGIDHKHPYAGWTVTAGTGDILPVYNPTGSAITYAIFLLGVG